MNRRLIKRSRKGMAMLMVLFIVMAIAIISAGFIARSDTALACGRNYCLRNEADYAAWGGMEVAWALVQDPNTLAAMTFPLTNQQLDIGSDIYYMLNMDNDMADPNKYSVECSGYYQTTDQVRSTLYGDLYYDSGGSTAYYISIRREP